MLSSSTAERRRRAIGTGMFCVVVIVLVLVAVVLINRVLVSPSVSRKTSSDSSLSRSPFDLMGMTQEQVQERLGSPSLDRDRTWQYRTSRGTLVIEFNNDVVVKVRPLVFDLTVITSALSSGLRTPIELDSTGPP